MTKAAVIQVRASEAKVSQYRELASRLGETLSEWVRNACDARANQQLVTPRLPVSVARQKS